MFLYLIGFVSQWHFLPIIPAACIAAARLIIYLSNKMVQKVLLSFIIISGIAIFGLASTTMIIATNDNSSYFEATAFVVRYLHNDNNGNADDNYYHNTRITVISNPFYSWIPLDVFHLNHNYYVDYYNDIIPVKTKKVLLTVDPPLIDRLSHNQAAKPIQKIYNSNNTKRIAIFGQVSIYFYDDNSITVLNNK